MTDISIVIALYNGEAHLPRFVESLKQQTFTNFEALFVDDASKDGSLAMLEAVGAEDPRFKVIRHETNKGAGAARNTGIQHAEGETLCFADPDDLLPPASLEARFNAYRQHKAVVRACHMEISEANELLNHEIPPPHPTGPFNPNKVASRFGPSPFLCAHWTWLFPTKMIKRFGITNEEGSRTAEDILFLVRLFFHIHKLVWIKEPVYFWMKRKDSLSNTVYSVQHYFDYLQCVDEFYGEAIVRERVELADVFCDNYLTCYITHVVYQIANGKSTDEDAWAVVREAERICIKHNVFGRCLKRVLQAPTRTPGLFLLIRILSSEKASMTERILDGHNELRHLKKLKKKANTRQK